MIRKESGGIQNSQKRALTFELNVPSGTLVVGNDLRPYFDILGSYDICTPEGTVQTTKAMEQIGCAHAFVGNSCPGVYKVGPNQFTITSGGMGPRGGFVKPRGQHVATIVTDLWWYTIVDGDEYKRRLSHPWLYTLDWSGHANRVNKDTFEVTRIKVRPGVYTFTHFSRSSVLGTHNRSDLTSRPKIYSRFKWTREPDPARDYMGERQRLNFTAGQVIANKMSKYPNLYSVGRNGTQQAANVIFCVIGAGGDWHPNGFVVYDPDMKTTDPSVKIPRLNRAYIWYPLCKYSALCEAAGIGERKINLNPSFAKLAYEIVDSIIKYGSTGNSKNVAIALRCLRGLEKKYPRN